MLNVQSLHVAVVAGRRWRAFPGRPKPGWGAVLPRSCDVPSSPAMVLAFVGKKARAEQKREQNAGSNKHAGQGTTNGVGCGSSEYLRAS
jgi:hypothetical protein